MNQEAPVRVGEVRPSQLLWAHGCGAIVDLPQISVVTMGLDFWDTTTCFPIGEDRLVNAVRRVLGPQVSRLLGAPIRPTSEGPFNPFAPEARIGVPVSPFPRWIRCPICQRMGDVDGGLFELKPHAFRPDRVRFVHTNCDRANQPTAVPTRFLVACRAGHLDDFPWHFFAHGGASDCPGPLRFFEQGASLQTENLWVQCERCNSSRSMVDAFGDKGKQYLPSCRGRHPHLGRMDQDCEEPLRAVMLGASNSWFPVTLTVLAIPTKGDKLRQLVADKLDLLRGVPSREVLPAFVEALAKTGVLPGIGQYSSDEIWQALEEARANAGTGEPTIGEQDLKIPEWEAFTSTTLTSDWPDFMVHRVTAPARFEGFFDYTVLAERLREVNALVGFTRVEPPEERCDGGNPPTRAPLASGRPDWVPATEVRGEGIFLRFQQRAVIEWLARAAVRERNAHLLAGHRAFRAARKLLPHEASFPGILYVLVHTFAHVLIRELALECGYSAASVRERIYASRGMESPEVAGILVYTAAPDSDGTLGGLVDLGKPENLGPLIRQALERTRICASDPLCAEHVPTHDRSLHGAACHACSFVAETSCEGGNRYLDRALLVPTLFGADLAFFRQVTE